MSSVFFVQQNFTVGDIDGNSRLIADAATAAHHDASGTKADVVLTPEMSLLGYPAEDVLYSPALQQLLDQTLTQLALALPPALAVVVGTALRENGKRYNGSALLRGGKVEATYKKVSLPNFSVFDEKRYFHAHDNPPLVFTAGHRRYALQICQDIWCDEQLPRIAASGADALLVQNGSPFHIGKHTQRQAAVARCAQYANMPVYYANTVGAQDELVFDGASFAVAADGRLTAQLPAFSASNSASNSSRYPDYTTALYQALVLGIRDYVHKSRFAKGVLLGLSGGIDSALVAVLATAALGAEQVSAVMLPSRYTSSVSCTDAAALARNLGIHYLNLPLEALHQSASDCLLPHLVARADDVTAENLQARLRGTLLMAIANNRDLLLLATGNKSELACGYATLYGDMNGGFAPIKDVLKTQVWALARYYNQQVAAVIPERIITRAPSAELRPDQTDQDSLPPYPVLDAMIQDHIAQRPFAHMANAYGNDTVQQFYRRLQISEYKRRQAPPGSKISECSFGKDWRMPVANGYLRYG